MSYTARTLNCKKKINKKIKKREENIVLYML